MRRSYIELREPYSRLLEGSLPPWEGAPAGTLIFAPGPESCRKDDGNPCAAGDPISSFWDIDDTVFFGKESDGARPILEQDGSLWRIKPDGVDDRLFLDLGSDFTVFDVIAVATRATDVGPLNGDYQSSRGQAAYEINQRNALWGGGLPLEDPDVLPAGVPSVRANTFRSSGTCILRTNGIQKRTGSVNGYPIRQMRLFLNNYDDSASDGPLYWLQVLPGAVFPNRYRNRVTRWLMNKYVP